MKKALLPITLICFILILIVVSCKKSNNDNNKENPVTTSLNHVFKGLRSTPQNFSITVGRDTIVYGAQGTVLHFYANSFMNGSKSDILTSGIVTVQLVEMYNAGDMICNRMTTIANGQILLSGGEVIISATLGLQTIFANVYGIGFPHRNVSGTTMSLFYGRTDNTDSVVTWTQSNTALNGTVAKGTTVDSARHIYYPIFNFDSCNSFTEVNTDCFWHNDSPKTSVSIILPDTSFNPKNTAAFVVLSNVSVWGSMPDTTIAVLSTTGQWAYNHYIAATNTFNMEIEGTTQFLPVGLNYKLIVITNKSGEYYYWQTSGVVPHNGIFVTAAPVSTTQGNIVSLLQRL